MYKNTDDEIWFAIVNTNIPVTKIEGVFNPLLII